MPMMEEKELNAVLRKHFENYGDILSMMTKVDPNFKRPFGFICFKTHEGAQKALEELHNADIFENDMPIYVGWALTKAERER